MRLTDRTVDLARLTIEHDDGTTSSLTAREGALLAYLAARPEQDVSRDDLLDEVWEYKANYATRAVDVAMRRLRSKVEPDPANPVHLISVHGVGYRFVPPAQATPAAAPRVAAPPRERRTNLPADQTSFVGRADDLAAVARQFRSGARLVTVLGPGGIGKTRLASQFGRSVFESAAPAGGVWFCDLSEASELAGLLAAVASALEIPMSEVGLDAVTDQIGHALADRGPVLLVLDNFEQLVRFAHQTVERWSRLAPLARFLVASRERLRITGEAIYELGPLPEDDALSLFLERARAAGADLDADDRSIRAIIRSLDGLPLAIELAAPRARVLSPAQLLDRLSARFTLLRGGTGAGRQATLHEAIDWSWELLQPWERDALTQCAIFSGGFTLEAVEGVVSLEDTGAPWALDVIEALRDKSLLRVYEPPDLPGELRFGMYESIRAYALDRLDPESADAVADRHADWCVAEGERLADAIDGHGGLEAARRLGLETDNLLAVWRRMADRAPVAAVRAALVLEVVFSTQGPFDTWLALVDKLVELAERHAPSLVPRALLARANASSIRGQLDRARLDLERALPLVEGRGDEEELRVLHARAGVDADQGRLAEASAAIARALAMARASSLRRWEGILLGQLGSIQLMQGDVGGAEDRMRRALVIHQEVGNERHQALTWANLGVIQLDHGRLEEAERNLQQALSIARRTNNLGRVATSLLMLGGVRCARWRLEEAEALLRDALKVYRSVGYRRFAGIATSSLGAVYLAQGRLDAALEELRSALDVLEQVGDRASQALTLALLGAVHAERDEIAVAAREIERAAAASEGSAQGQAFVRAALGFLAVAKAREARRRVVDPSEVQARLAEARAHREGQPGDDRTHTRRFVAAILDRAIARSEQGAPRGPW